MTDPTFIIEKDSVGLGYRVAVAWPDGRREEVAGFGDPEQATRWIREESARWLLDIPKRAQGEQWINNRLPKTP